MPSRAGALGHHYRPVGRLLGRPLSAQGQSVESVSGLIDKPRIVGGGVHEEFDPARNHQSHIVGTGMTAVGDAYFARPHPTSSETLRPAAPGDHYHRKALSSAIENGMHEPALTLVTRWHHPGGVDHDQPGSPRDQGARGVGGHCSSGSVATTG
jgi:hypothetical protein